jgi:hypothetical protein
MCKRETVKKNCELFVFDLDHSSLLINSGINVTVCSIGCGYISVQTVCKIIHSETHVEIVNEAGKLPHIWKYSLL